MSIGTAIIRRARQIEYDHQTSGLTADNVQQMGDELAGLIAGIVPIPGPPGPAGPQGPQGPAGPRAVVMLLACAYTPAITGPDSGEVPVPYDSADGTTVRTFNIRRITLRVANAGGAPSLTVEKSTAAGAFGAAAVGTVTLAGGAFEGSVTPAGQTAQSGDKLRFNVGALGTAQNWTVLVELGE